MSKNRSSINGLHMVITELHNCVSFRTKSVPLHLKLPDHAVWEGVVEVFDLIGHPKAQRCYAWVTPSNGNRGTGEGMMTVLEIPPVTSPETAVTAANEANSQAKKKVGRHECLSTDA